MKIFEVENGKVSRDAYVTWLVRSMNDLMQRAYNQAERSMRSSENAKLARMHGGGVIGAWFSENRINPRGYSINGLLTMFGATSLMPHVPGTSRDKEESGYSNTGALKAIIAGLTPILTKQGYGSEIKQVQGAYTEYIRRVERMIADYLNDGDDDDTPAPKKPSAPVEDPNKQAHAIINQVIGTLPRDHQGKAREFIQRRGNTLQALKRYMDGAGLS